MAKMAATLSSRTFLLNFWFLPVFVVVFIVFPSRHSSAFLLTPVKSYCF